MQTSVRRATTRDRAAICGLHLESWQASYRSDVPKDVLEAVFPVEMEKQWAARTFCSPELILVAEDRQLMGFVFALTDRDIAFIDNLHVRPNLQSKGIGAALLRAVFAELRAKGFETAMLEVLETNRRALDFLLEIRWAGCRAVPR